MADSELSILVKLVDKATGPMNKMAKGLGKIGKAATKAGKAMTKNVTIPIIAIGVASTKAFADFEAGMGNVATLVDTTTEDMAAMGKAVQNIAKDVPVGLDELTVGLYDVRSAGIPAADAMNVLDKSARLAVAGLATTAEATDIVTSAINSFGLKGKEADQIYDVLFTAVKHGKTTLSGLGVGFGKVAGKVAAAGIANDEYIATVSALTTTGVPAAQAHTQMAAVLAGLSRKTKQTSKVFRQLGVKDFKELIKRSGGLVPALEAVNGAVKGNDGALIKLLGSTEAHGAVVSIVGKQNVAYTETLADMRDGVKEVDKAFDKQNNTAAAKWKKTKNRLISAAISLGTILAPAAEKAAAKLEGLVSWFTGLDEGTKKTIVQIAGIAAVIGPALIVFGKLATGIGAIISVATKLSTLLAANPIMALAIVIGLAALEIYRNWEDFEQFFQLIWDGVTGIFDDASDFIVKKMEEIAAALSELGDLVMRNKGLFSVVADGLGAGTAGDIVIKANERKQEGETAATREAAASLERVRQNRMNAGDVQAAAAAQKNEITLTIEGAPATVKAMKGPAVIDVKTGHQGAF